MSVSQLAQVMASTGRAPKGRVSRPPAELSETESPPNHSAQRLPVTGEANLFNGKPVGRPVYDTGTPLSEKERAREALRQRRKEEVAPVKTKTDVFAQAELNTQKELEALRLQLKQEAYQPVADGRSVADLDSSIERTIFEPPVNPKSGVGLRGIYHFVRFGIVRRKHLALSAAGLAKDKYAKIQAAKKKGTAGPDKRNGDQTHEVGKKLHDRLNQLDLTGGLGE